MKKKFDAVKFQRKVREELSKKYSFNRDAFLHELKDKYEYLRKQKTTSYTKESGVSYHSSRRRSP